MNQNFLNLRIQLKPWCFCPREATALSLVNSQIKKKNPIQEFYKADHVSRTLLDMYYELINSKGLSNKPSYVNESRDISCGSCS